MSPAKTEERHEMIAIRGAGITLIVISLFLVLGCDREEPKTDFELGQGYFRASDYKKAMIRLETWLQLDPDNASAHAMLAVMYHDDETRQALFEAKLKKLQSMGERGMTAVLYLTRDPTTASRLGRTINEILARAGKPSVGPLMKDLKGSNWRLRKNAQVVLMQIGEPAVETLIEALDDPDLYTRSMSIEALSKIGDKRAVEPLKQKLNDSNKLIQVEVAAALHNMGEENPRKIILDALEDGNVEVRRAATKAVWELIDDPPVKPLLKAMEDVDPQVRNYATMAVGKTCSLEAIDLLLKSLKEDESNEVKGSAGKALENIGKPCVELLIGLLEETKDISMTIRLVQLLGNIGDKRAIKPLEKVYNEAGNPLLKNETAKALNKID